MAEMIKALPGRYGRRLPQKVAFGELPGGHRNSRHGHALSWWRLAGWPVLGLLGCLILMRPAMAFSTFLHLQGEVGNREAYFSEISASDRTPMTREALLGPTSVREIGVTAVYEHPSKPEWVTMRLQFECPNTAVAMVQGKAPARPVLQDSVRFRIVPVSYLVRRSDLASEPVAETGWNTSSAPMLVKASRVACNSLAVEAAVRRAIKNPPSGSLYDEAGFGRDMQALGLPADLVLLGHDRAADQLDFCWTYLWDKRNRPDPSGKWSRPATDAERAEAMRRAQQLQDESAPLLEAARASLEGNIRAMQAERQFEATSRAVRGQRPLNKFETNLIAVWSGHTEAEVVAKMGPPLKVSEQGTLRTLSYSREYDKRVTVGDMKTGAAWEEGNYSRCDMDFILAPDANRAWRVADVRVSLDSNAFLKFTCQDLSQVPD